MQPHEQETTSLYNSSLSPAAQREAFTSGAVPVAIYGLGKMGLPLAAVFADVTHNTTGVDIDESVVQSVNDGQCHVDNEPGLPDKINKATSSGELRATSDIKAAAKRAHVHVIVVPTVVSDDNSPDLSNLEAVLEAIGPQIAAGDLVVIESTVPPGTCATLVAPLLEAESDSDISVGQFGLAFCPERTASGRALQDIRGSYPKVVGGIDEESTRAAKLIYNQITENDVLAVSDATTAECVKVFEGVYRDVNIALANELATFADELAIDVTEAIDVANTQPYCDIHTPGPGVGGHCIPYYPYFLIETLETPSPLLETARTVNESMPAFTVQKLRERLEAQQIDLTDATIAVLGIAYRPGVNETRESPGLHIIDQLTNHDATVYAVDPVVDTEKYNVESVTVDSLQQIDCDGIVIATDHDTFDDIDWSSIDKTVIVDGRDVIDHTICHNEDSEEHNHIIYKIGSNVSVSNRFANT